MSAQKTGASAGCVLVIDDVPFCQAALKKCLTGLGYEVVCVGSGLEALRAIRREPGRFDAALCDLMMPGMDGLDLLRQAALTRWAQGRAPLPFVLLTASCDTHRLRQAEAAGFVCALSKPVTRDALQEVLGRFARPAIPLAR